MARLEKLTRNQRVALEMLGKKKRTKEEMLHLLSALDTLVKRGAALQVDQNWEITENGRQTLNSGYLDHNRRDV